MKQKNIIFIIIFGICILLIIFGINIFQENGIKNNELIYEKNKNNIIENKNDENLMNYEFNLINSGSLNSISFETYSKGDSCGCYAYECKVLIKNNQENILEINSKKSGPCDELETGIPINF